MASTTAPSTPENAAPPHVLRRAFTAPIKFAAHAKSDTLGRKSAGQEVETLFAYHGCKIVSFSPSSALSRPSSSGLGREAQEYNPVGILPWTSATERTIATGPLRVYRALGTVAFLNSGDILKPIFAKSQCWCVDGESKFVLRIQHNFYYRIELPNETAEDKAKTETLKEVFGNILRYEVTPCPFKRGFTVPLPEAPKTPIRKRPWRPQQRPQSPSRGNNRSLANGKDDKFHALNASGAEPSDNDKDSEDAVSAQMAPRAVPSHSYEDLDILKTPTRLKALSAGRSVTAPLHLSLQTTPPSNIEIRRQPSMLGMGSPSLSSSVDSFHSFHSPISSLPPSPPYSQPPSSLSSSDDDAGIQVSRSRRHQRDKSELTVTPGTVLSWEPTVEATEGQNCETSSPVLMATPALTNDTGSQSGDLWPEIVSPATPSPSPDIRHRKTPSLRRTGSPLPSPANLYSPRSRMSGHHLTTAILQRTCSMLLGPPIQLVALMLNIAAKIAKGAMRGASFGFGEAGQKIPCSWDYSDPEDDPDYWEEDDFGVSLSKLGNSRTSRRKEGQSWEID